jgi:thioredoxin 1
MKKTIVIVIIAVVLGGVYWFNFRDTAAVVPTPGPNAAAGPTVPVKGMVTMIDLGADKCIPCKMMAPILVELEKEYRGRAAIVFLDVWKDAAPAKRFGIRAIPTQIFFNEKGEEISRHEGFFSKEEIVAKLTEMGVKNLEANNR